MLGAHFILKIWHKFVSKWTKFTSDDKNIWDIQWIETLRDIIISFILF